MFFVLFPWHGPRFGLHHAAPLGFWCPARAPRPAAPGRGADSPARHAATLSVAVARGTRGAAKRLRAVRIAARSAESRRRGRHSERCLGCADGADGGTRAGPSETASQSHDDCGARGDRWRAAVRRLVNGRLRRATPAPPGDDRAPRRWLAGVGEQIGRRRLAVVSGAVPCELLESGAGNRERVGRVWIWRIPEFLEPRSVERRRLGRSRKRQFSLGQSGLDVGSDRFWFAGADARAGDHRAGRFESRAARRVRMEAPPRQRGDRS